MSLEIHLGYKKERIKNKAKEGEKKQETVKKGSRRSRGAKTHDCRKRKVEVEIRQRSKKSKKAEKRKSKKAKKQRSWKSNKSRTAEKQRSRKKTKERKSKKAEK